MDFPDPAATSDPRLEENRLSTFAELLTSLRNSHPGVAESGSDISRRPFLRRSQTGNIRDYSSSMNRIPHPHSTQLHSQTGQGSTNPIIIVADRTGGFIWDQQAVLHAISPFNRSPYHGIFSSFSSRQQQLLSARNDDVEVMDLFLSDSEDVPVALTTGLDYDAAQAGNDSRTEQNQNPSKSTASKSELGKHKIKPKKAARFTKSINRA